MAISGAAASSEFSEDFVTLETPNFSSASSLTGEETSEPAAAAAAAAAEGDGFEHVTHSATSAAVDSARRSASSSSLTGSEAEAAKPLFPRRSPNEVYGIEFLEYFGSSSKLESVRQFTIAGNLSKTKFRGILWNILLGLLRNDLGTWRNSIMKRRKAYKDLQNELIRGDPPKAPVSAPPPPKAEGGIRRLEVVDNPLSTDDDSAWNRYFHDREVRENIYKDAVRTHAANPFFKEESVRQLMVDVIFIYAKKHPDLGFRQGMLDILAAVLMVLKGDIEHHQNSCKEDLLLSKYSPPTERKPSDFTEKLSENSRLFQYIFDPKYLEHDSYFLFEKIMEQLHDSYYVDPRPAPPPSARRDPARLFDNDSEDEEYGGTYRARIRLNGVFHKTLKSYDKEYYDHLISEEVIPSAFGMNWMKLLYSRQFANNQFLCIWDVIFATNFAAADNVIVAMILAVKDLLMGQGSTEIYHVLVSKYPEDVSSRYVMNLALHLTDGTSYPKPTFSPYVVRNSHELPALFPPPISLKKNKIIPPSAKKLITHFDGRRKNPRCYELDDFALDDETEGGRSLESLKDRVSYWRDKLDFNITFLSTCFQEHSDKDEKLTKILANIIAIRDEMNVSLEKSRKVPLAGKRSTTSYAQDALDLINDK